jgi:beta-glucosidase
LQWNGKAQASAGFIAKERVDYSSQPEKAALVFDIKVDKKPTADVKLIMGCGSDCGAEKSITDALQKANAGQWQTLSVSMSCFSKVKLDMLLSPFMLSTNGELGITLHHVRIESTPTASIQCP